MSNSFLSSVNAIILYYKLNFNFIRQFFSRSCILDRPKIYQLDTSVVESYRNSSELFVSTNSKIHTYTSLQVRHWLITSRFFRTTFIVFCISFFTHCHLRVCLVTHLSSVRQHVIEHSLFRSAQCVSEVLLFITTLLASFNFRDQNQKLSSCMILLPYFNFLAWAGLGEGTKHTIIQNGRF